MPTKNTVTKAEDVQRQIKVLQQRGAAKGDGYFSLLSLMYQYADCAKIIAGGQIRPLVSRIGVDTAIGMTQERLPATQSATMVFDVEYEDCSGAHMMFVKGLKVLPSNQMDQSIWDLPEAHTGAADTFPTRFRLDVKGTLDPSTYYADLAKKLFAMPDGAEKLKAYQYLYQQLHSAAGTQVNTDENILNTIQTFIDSNTDPADPGHPSPAPAPDPGDAKFSDAGDELTKPGDPPPAGSTIGAIQGAIDGGVNPYNPPPADGDGGGSGGGGGGGEPGQDPGEDPNDPNGEGGGGDGDGKVHTEAATAMSEADVEAMVRQFYALTRAMTARRRAIVQKALTAAGGASPSGAPPRGAAEAECTVDADAIRKLDQTALRDTDKTGPFQLLLAASPSFRAFFSLFTAGGYNADSLLQLMMIYGSWVTGDAPLQAGDIAYVANPMMSNGGQWGLTIDASGRTVNEVLLCNPADSRAHLLKGNAGTVVKAWRPSASKPIGDDSPVAQFWGPALSRMRWFLSARGIPSEEELLAQIFGQASAPRSLNAFLQAYYAEIKPYAAATPLFTGCIVFGQRKGDLGVVMSDGSVYARMGKPTPLDCGNPEYVSLQVIAPRFVWYPHR